jgi:DNA-binding transcriptional ArsR family regulator
VPHLPQAVDRHSNVQASDIDHRLLGTRSEWLERAARLPGKSMHLAIVLLRIAAVEQTRRVVLSNLACQCFGLNRNSKYRALRSLENAGLITVERKLGRSPIAMIVSDGDGAA